MVGLVGGAASASRRGMIAGSYGCGGGQSKGGNTEQKSGSRHKIYYPYLVCAAKITIDGESKPRCGRSADKITVPTTTMTVNWIFCTRVM